MSRADRKVLRVGAQRIRATIKELDRARATGVDVLDELTKFRGRVSPISGRRRRPPEMRRNPEPKTVPAPRLDFPELDGLVGMAPIREHLASLAAQVWVEMQRSRGDGDGARIALPHLVFAGPPGTGKTTVAAALGGGLKRIGALEKGHVVQVSRADLVGRYIGHTAERVDKAVDRAMGGVLFIDEAYSLVSPDSPRDYGHEAVATLLQRLENDRGDFLCVVAGYPDEMDDFLRTNPGLRSRFAVTVPFADYDEEELVEIAKVQLRADGYALSRRAAEALPERLRLLRLRRGWANARSTRVYLEEARRRQALRLARAGGRPSRMNLSQLTLADLPEVSEEEPMPDRTPPVRAPRPTSGHAPATDPALARAVDELARVARALAVRPAPATPVPRRRRRRVPHWLSGLVAILGLELALLLWWLSQSGGLPDLLVGALP